MADITYNQSVCAFRGTRPSRRRSLLAVASASLLAAATLVSLTCAPLSADTIGLGVFSFNTLIPGAPGSPGVNDFAIDNFTGSSALPPDFPATDALTFMNSAVVLTMQGGSQQTVSLGDLGPGSVTPTALQFSATTNFTSAVFTATLSPTIFAISGGGSFQASSSQISAILSPS
jgi:hypothetical protein